MTPEQFRNFVLSELSLRGLRRKALAKEYGCAVSQIYKVLAGHRSNPLRAFIARKCGRESWESLQEAGRRKVKQIH